MTPRDDGERLTVLLRDAVTATRRAANLARCSPGDLAAVCAAVEAAFGAVKRARARAICLKVGNPPWHYARLDVNS